MLHVRKTGGTAVQTALEAAERRQTCACCSTPTASRWRTCPTRTRCSSSCAIRSPASSPASRCADRRAGRATSVRGRPLSGARSSASARPRSWRRRLGSSNRDERADAERAMQCVADLREPDSQWLGSAELRAPGASASCSSAGRSASTRTSRRSSSCWAFAVDGTAHRCVPRQPQRGRRRSPRS